MGVKPPRAVIRGILREKRGHRKATKRSQEEGAEQLFGDHRMRCCSVYQFFRTSLVLLGIINPSLDYEKLKFFVFQTIIREIIAEKVVRRRTYRRKSHTHYNYF